MVITTINDDLMLSAWLGVVVLRVVEVPSGTVVGAVLGAGGSVVTVVLLAGDDMGSVVTLVAAGVVRGSVVALEGTGVVSGSVVAFATAGVVRGSVVTFCGGSVVGMLAVVPLSLAVEMAGVEGVCSVVPVGTASRHAY